MDPELSAFRETDGRGEDAASEVLRCELRVRGVVQGVGFRPFVYRLAVEEHLAGLIGNDTDGVFIEIEGPAERVAAFQSRLRREAPPLSRIDSVEARALAVKGDSGFCIVASEVLGRVSTGIPADAATCDDCLRELLDPTDRRYRYPFLNCTNCGPRFTITRQIPYDRPQTSMAVFPMCEACRREYDDPLNRRFHAQPNACRDCGPHVWLSNRDGVKIHVDDPVMEAVERLLTGEIVAMRGIGGFHLAVNAKNEEAVKRLRQRKRRFGKPLAVMVKDLQTVRRLCATTSEDETLIATPARPIVLMRARDGTGIAPSVAPEVPWLGVYLPYAPLQHLLFADSRLWALVMTSANLSEEPIAIDNDEARERLAEIADVFLLHNREILQRCDDSVAATVDGAAQLIRRARGYVPLAVDLPFDAPPLLAVGGHLKNAFVLARGRMAYQSQHLGDLETVTALDFFEESLGHLMRTFEIEPQAAIHDLHPGYMSTVWVKKWAEERGLPLIAVQHHHAHIAACMAEHKVEGPVIGLSLDGTGYGTDGNVWGGEVLICSYEGFERFAHLDYVPMPGSEAAIREPWRMAVGHLSVAGVDVESDEILKLLGVSRYNVRVIRQMVERQLNAPLTSSCGRLFDAVASVVLGRQTVDYEAQAAVELEGVAIDEPDDLTGYEMEISEGDWPKREAATISAAPLWRELLRDLSAGVPKAHIAARFHAGVAAAYCSAAVLARAATGMGRVALSGGCLHNRRLTRLLRRGLEAEGFEVLQHRQVSPGDAGLSFGQAVVGAAILERKKTDGTADSRVRRERKEA